VYVCECMYLRIYVCMYMCVFIYLCVYVFYLFAACSITAYNTTCLEKFYTVFIYTSLYP